MTSVYEGNKNKPVKTHTCIQKPINQTKTTQQKAKKHLSDTGN